MSVTRTSPVRNAVAGYAVAIVAVAGALALRVLLEPLTGIGAPWVVFFSAVVVASLYGGVGPGICATVLSGPIAAYVFVLPAGHTPSQAAAQALLFTVDGFVLVYLSSLITHGRRLAEASAAAHARSEERLRDEDRKKDEFLAMLSHELRNPLAAIRSSVHVLDRARPGSPPARRAHGIIDRQVGQLSRLIDDLLDVTRIARGKLRLQREPVELGELVHRTVDDLRALAEARGNTIEFLPAPEPLWVDGDEARLVQVVGNLLHNAAKFTRGGRIDVSLGREGADVVLRVRDTGAGIPAEDLPRVFTAFVQLDRTTGGADGGLGLGLALVKGIVELHGGSASAASAGSGRGSEFSIRFPRVDAPEPGGDTAIHEPGHGRRVLVIEDNTDVADALTDMLRFMGHDVQVAPDGASGIVAASEFHPEVVLCDIGLPGMSGYEVARRMRADETLRGATLVALSGYGQPEDRQRAAEAGFARHVVKPATLDVLERALAS